MRYFHYEFKYPKTGANTRNIRFPFHLETERNNGSRVGTTVSADQNDLVIGYVITIQPQLSHPIQYTDRSDNQQKKHTFTYKLVYKTLLWSHIENDQDGYALYKSVPFKEIEGVEAFKFDQNSYEQDSFEISYRSNAGNSVTSNVHHVRFNFQPNMSYYGNSGGGYQLDQFDFCFLSRDQFRYLMNDIINNPNHEGNLVISGLNLEMGEVVPAKNENPKDKYFTLKLQAYLTEEANVPSYSGISSPIHMYTAPCPPFWNPTFIPKIVGISESEICVKFRKFENRIFPPRPEEVIL